MRKNVNPIAPPVVAPTELSIYTTNKEDLASMMEYALMITDPNKDVKVINTKVTQVQIASSATKLGAEKFIAKERTKGYKMVVVSGYSAKLQQTRYKVVILCDSKASAVAIVNSKQYNGAYILR
jgi:hypothetical protein